MLLPVDLSGISQKRSGILYWSQMQGHGIILTSRTTRAIGRNDAIVYPLVDATGWKFHSPQHSILPFWIQEISRQNKCPPPTTTTTRSNISTKDNLSFWFVQFYGSGYCNPKSPIHQKNLSMEIRHSSYSSGFTRTVSLS